MTLSSNFAAIEQLLAKAHKRTDELERALNYVQVRIKEEKDSSAAVAASATNAVETSARLTSKALSSIASNVSRVSRLAEHAQEVSAKATVVTERTASVGEETGWCTANMAEILGKLANVMEERGVEEAEEVLGSEDELSRMGTSSRVCGRDLRSISASVEVEILEEERDDEKRATQRRQETMTIGSDRQRNTDVGGTKKRTFKRTPKEARFLGVAGPKGKVLLQTNIDLSDKRIATVMNEGL